MALSPSYRNTILSQLSPQFREMYDSGQITDDQLEVFANQIGLEAPADFSGVSSSVDTTANDPVVEDTRERDMSALLGSLSGNPALEPGFDIDGTVGALVASPEARSAVGAAAESGVYGALSAAQNLKRRLDTVNVDNPNLPGERQSELVELQNTLTSRNEDTLQGLRAHQQTAQERQQEAMSRIPEGALYESAETAGDILGSPESFLSVLGPAGSIAAVAGQFGRTLDQADAAGVLDEGDAVAYAAAKTVPSLLEFLPGRVGSVAKRNVDNLFSSGVWRTLLRGGTEAGTEAAQSAAEMGIDKALAEFSDDPAMREYARGQVPESTAQFFDNLWRSARAGGVAGTALTTPGEVMTAMADAGRRAAAVASGREQANLRSELVDATRPTPVEPTPQEDTLIREQEIEEAYRQRTTEVDPAAERARNAELQLQSLGRRVDTERQQVESLQERIEGGDTSQSTLAAMARATSRQRQAEELYNNQLTRMQPAVVEPVAPAPVDEPAPVVQGPEAPTPERIKAREKAVKEAAKLVQGDTKKARATAQSKRNAARNTFLRARRDELVAAGTTGDELVQQLADARLTWDDTNTIDMFLPTPAATPAPATPKAAPVAATTETVEDTEEATVPVNTLDTLEREMMSQRTTGEGTGVTTDQVFDTFDKSITSADTGRFTGLLSDGNVEVVRSVGDIVENQGDLLPQGKGFYDPNSGKVLIVADQLDPQNIKGDVMSVLAHEVKHAADRGGFTPARGSLKNIIGDKNNAQVVKQIEALAKQNTPIGQRANAMLTQVKNAYPESAWSEEIPANFINLAMAERTGPGRSLISAIRTKYKDLTGKTDLNLNDVKYLADQLVREGAQTGTRFQGTAEGQGNLLPMIVGPQHPQFEEFREQGRVYTGPEGNERAVISDVGSRVNIDDLTRRVLSMDNGRPIPLTRMLQHEELYAAYPQLQDIEVVIDPDLDKGHAYYLENQNVIGLSRGHIAELLQGDRGKAAVRGSLLHEIQHAIQGYEGNARGANVDQFLTNSDRTVINRYETANADLMTLVSGTVSNPDSLSGLAPSTKNELRQIGEIFNTGINDGVINEVIGTLREDGSREAESYIREIESADRKVKDMMPDVEQRRAAAEKKYYDTYGEIEAYFTETTRNLPQDQLPVNPEDVTQQNNFRATGVQRTDRPNINMPGSGITQMSQQIPSRDQTFQFAEEFFGDQDTARNFTNWFRDSKVVDENGNPRVMYHGTRTTDDFTTFIPGEEEPGIHVGTQAQANDPAFVGAIHTTNPERTDRDRTDKAPRIVPLFVRIENPLRVPDMFANETPAGMLEIIRSNALRKGVDVTEGGANQVYLDLLDRPGDVTFDDVRGYAQRLGFDSFVYTNETEGVSNRMSRDPSIRLFNPFTENTPQDSYVVFNSNQLKSTTGNNGNFDNSRLSFLAQTSGETAGRAIPEAATEDQGMTQTERVARRLLLPAGGYPPALNEAMNASRNLQSGRALQADKLALDFARAINRNRVTKPEMRGMSEEEARNVILERIDAIDKLETRAARNEALDELNREYPTVGEAVRKIRDLKLSFTRELFALRRRNPTDMTAKEHNVFKKMAENAERYTTRAYLATYNAEVGKSYGKRLIETARRNPESREAQVIGDAIDYLVQNELMIPDGTAMRKAPIADLRRMYTHWGLGDASQFKNNDGKVAIIRELEDFRAKADSSNLEAKAMTIIEDMLGLSGKKESRRVMLSSGARQNRTILEGRTDMPEALRKLMGEITDPVVRESLSLARMSNLVAKTQLLTEAYERGRNQWWNEIQTPKYNRQLNGEAYGPMNGKWVDQNAEDALTGMISVEQNMDALLSDMVKNPDAFPHMTANVLARGIRKIMRMQKMVQVVINPANMALNLVGAPAMLLSNGVNPKYIRKAMVNTARALSYDVSKRTASDEGLEAGQELIEAGAIDSASVGEFQGDMYQTIIKEMKKLTDGGKTPAMTQMWRTVTSVTGVGRDGIRQAYAFMDVWAKAATYYSRKDFLTDYYKAEGITKDDATIRREAGYAASGTNISYERAIPLVRMLEQNTPFAMFLTYFSETFRATGMNYLQAYRDAQMAKNATTPEGRRLAATEAAKRAAGTTALLSGVIGGTLAALSLEDEDEKAQRALDPDYLRDTVLVPIGTTADGKVQWMSLNRLDPIGPLNELVIKIARAEDKPEAVMEGIMDMFVTSKSVLAAGQVIADMGAAMGAPWEDGKRNKNTLTEKNFPEMYRLLTSFRNDGDVPENLIAAVEGVMVPSAISGQFDDSRNALGYRPHVRDPHKSLGFRIYDYKNATKDLRKEFTEYLKDPGRSAADISTRMNAVLRDEREAYNDLNEALEGFLASPKDQLDVSKGKLSRSEAAAIFKAERQAALLPSLVRGRFVSTAIKLDDIKGWYKTRLKDPNVDKKELRKDYQTMLDVYKGALTDGS